MAELFNRDLSITIGTSKITTRSEDADVPAPILKATFTIEKSLSKDPNTCEINIWNLADKSRSLLQEKGQEIIIEAGYVGNTAIIFKGDVTKSTSRRDRTDWITTVQSGDGDLASKVASISKGYAKGTKTEDIIKDVADAIASELKTDSKSFLKKVKDWITSGEGKNPQDLISLTGEVVTGKANDMMEKLVNRTGGAWSIQNKQLQFSGKNTDVLLPAVLLGSTSGLIGSPEVADRRKKKGEKPEEYIKAKSLLIPTIEPGRQIDLDSIAVKGSCRVEKVIYAGDTRGSEFFAEFEATIL